MSTPRRRLTHVPGEAGIWVFILGDMTMYGVLFTSFLFDRGADAALFDRSADTLHPIFGLINTFLLLTSSILVVYGVRTIRDGVAVDRGRLLFSLAIMCALAFIVNKGIEWSDLVGSGFTPTTNTFYQYYFMLTGIHLTHLIAGTCVLVFLRHVAGKGRWTAQDVRATETGASFWHVVDLLWVALFALLYLVR